MNKILIIVIHAVFIIFLSTTQAQWVQTSGPIGGTVIAFGVSGQTLTAGTSSGGVHWSSNFGVSWNQSLSLNNAPVTSFTTKGSNIFAGVPGGVYVSSDDGRNWTQTSPINNWINCLSSNDSSIFAGASYPSGLYISTNDGLNWFQSISNRSVLSVLAKGAKIFAGTSDEFNGYYRLQISTNNGLNWTQISLNNQYINSLAAKDSIIFAGTSGGIYISTDNGSSWIHSTYVLSTVNSVFINGENIFAGTNSTIYKSTDNGANWVQTSLTNRYVRSIYSTGSNVYAGATNYGIYFSNNYGNNWVQLPIYCQNISALQNYNSDIYACTYGLYITQSEGQVWTATPLSNTYVYALAFDLPYIYAAGSKMYVSTDSGMNWTITVNNNTFYAITMFGSRVIAGAGNGIFISTNHGQNWAQTFVNPISCILTKEQSVYTGTANGFYKSIDSGVTFTQILAVRDLNCVAIVDSTFYLGTRDSGVYISTNDGTNWKHSSLRITVRSLAANSSVVLAGTPSNGVYKSTDKGLNWIQINDGMGPVPVYSLLITNTYAFAGTYGSSVWKRPISQIVGSGQISSSLPFKYYLSQNYPNPFNPVTKIKFSIPLSRGVSAGRGVLVKLIVYNILGKEITDLVNQGLTSGTYEVQWDGSNYPSGVYFYRLTTNDYIETKKMVLIR